MGHWIQFPVLYSRFLMFIKDSLLDQTFSNFFLTKLDQTQAPLSPLLNEASIFALSCSLYCLVLAKFCQVDLARISILNIWSNSSSATSPQVLSDHLVPLAARFLLHQLSKNYPTLLVIFHPLTTLLLSSLAINSHFFVRYLELIPVSLLYCKFHCSSPLNKVFVILPQ